MNKLNDLHKSVLEQSPRAIVHMRKQVSFNRFGLVFGAGISKSLGIPTWGELISKLAKDSDVDGEALLKEELIPPRVSFPYRTEMLFEHFRKKRYDTVSCKLYHTRKLDFEIAGDWREKIRNHLYSGVQGNLGSSLDRHSYLKQFLPLIRRSHMTVTYNFDDFIEQALQITRIDKEKSTKGFESVTNPWTQYRRPTANIYHPNGVIPQERLETPSDRLVFSEASYVEQLMGIFSGDQAGLLNHFSKHTCLLIGLSLEDETLRNVLMQGARSAPGNFHYYVYYLKPDDELDDEEKYVITRANFKIYNLFTLFLDDDGIRALGELIDNKKCTEDQFCDFASENNIQVKFKYYVTGPLGVGKSTAINHFRNLHVLDEWLEQRLKILEKPWDDLTPEEKEEADAWIAGQFRQKNDILRHEKEGIFMMDRGPLDPLSFTSNDEWESKASRLLKKLCPGKAEWQVEDGRVILLQGEPEELHLRMVITKRGEYTADNLKEIEEKLSKAYGTEGVTVYDTRGLAPTDVVRRMAEIVHLEPYFPTCNLHERLQKIKKDGINATS